MSGIAKLFCITITRIHLMENYETISDTKDCDAARFLKCIDFLSYNTVCFSEISRKFVDKVSFHLLFLLPKIIRDSFAFVCF